MRVYEYVAKAPEPYVPVAPASTPDEVNQFLARTPRELEFCTTFDRGIIGSGDGNPSVLECLVKHSRVASSLYVEKYMNLTRVGNFLAENKQRVLARPEDMAYLDGLTQAQWERVIQGKPAIPCGMERHLERVAKEQEEARMQEEERSAAWEAAHRAEQERDTAARADGDNILSRLRSTKRKREDLAAGKVVDTIPPMPRQTPGRKNLPVENPGPVPFGNSADEFRQQFAERQAKRRKRFAFTPEQKMEEINQRLAKRAPVQALPAHNFAMGETDVTEIARATIGQKPWCGQPVCGVAAIGLKVNVYWEEETAWFAAIVVAYDPRRPERRYLLYYVDGELEWLSAAGPGVDEELFNFHEDAPDLKAVSILHSRLDYMRQVVSVDGPFISPCVVCGKDAGHQCSNATRYTVRMLELKRQCTSDERICLACYNGDSWECPTCVRLANAPLPPKPDFPWQMWNEPAEKTVLPRDTYPRVRSEVFFHRPTFDQGMAEWVAQAKAAGSPLPPMNWPYFALDFRPYDKARPMSPFPPSPSSDPSDNDDEMVGDLPDDSDGVMTEPDPASEMSCDSSSLPEMPDFEDLPEMPDLSNLPPLSDDNSDMSETISDSVSNLSSLSDCTSDDAIDEDSEEETSDDEEDSDGRDEGGIIDDAHGDGGNTIEPRSRR